MNYVMIVLNFRGLSNYICAFPKIHCLSYIAHNILNIVYKSVPKKYRIMAENGIGCLGTAKVNINIYNIYIYI